MGHSHNYKKKTNAKKINSVFYNYKYNWNVLKRTECWLGLGDSAECTRVCCRSATIPPGERNEKGLLDPVVRGLCCVVWWCYVQSTLISRWWFSSGGATASAGVWNLIYWLDCHIVIIIQQSRPVQSECPVAGEYVCDCLLTDSYHVISGEYLLQGFPRESIEATVIY